MITNLKIENFRDVHNVEYDRFGLINEFTGSNGTGKTTIIDCILWLLCDETIIFKNDNDKNVNTFQPNEIIECELTINDNVIKRKYGYKLNDDETITNINAFYINDRRVNTKKEYLSSIYNFTKFNVNALNKINNLKLNILKLLINPTDLLEGLEESKFRTMIEKLLNVDTTSILIETAEFAPLKDLFDKHGNDVNKVRDFLNQKISSSEKELLSHNANINLYKDYKYDPNYHQSLIDELEELKKTNYEESNEVDNLIKEKEQVFYDLQESIKNDNKKSRNPDLELLTNKGKELKEEVNALTQKVYQLTNFKLHQLENNEIRLKTVIDTAKRNLERTNRRELNETKCPNCGYVLSTENKEKFEKAKQNDLIQYTNDLTNAENELKLNETNIRVSKKEIENVKEELALKQKELENARVEYQKLLELEKNKTQLSSEKTNELETRYKELEIKIRDLSRAETEKRLDFNTNKLQKQSELNSKLLEVEKLKKYVETYNFFTNAKKECLYKKQQYETKLILIKKFANSEVELLNNYTKEIFGNEIEFIMLEQAKTTNTLKKVCYPKYKGKDYDSWNTAQRLLLAIKVVEAFKNYLGGVDLPIIFDVADNIGNTIIDEIYETSKSQMFFTTVKREDDHLRELIIRK